MLLYCLATMSWILMKDFKQMRHYHREGLTQKCGFKPTRETIRMILSKTLYIMYIVVLPLVLGVAWWAVLIGFVLMHMLAGLLITVIFQLAHVVEGPEHFAPEQTGTMENTWAIHQLKTTANFCRNNRLITWFVGGLNFQIEHHLFPHICHVHYKKISEIVFHKRHETRENRRENISCLFSHLKFPFIGRLAFMGDVEQHISEGIDFQDVRLLIRINRHIYTCIK